MDEMNFSRTLNFRSPKRLEASEWADLKGSTLFERMFHNRMVVELPSSDATIGFNVIVDEWLAAHCNSYYYSCGDGSRKITFYFEKDADALHFKMFFEGKDHELFSEFYQRAMEIRRMRFPDLDEERARILALERLKQRVLEAK